MRIEEGENSVSSVGPGGLRGRDRGEGVLGGAALALPLLT